MGLSTSYRHLSQIYRLAVSEGPAFALSQTDTAEQAAWMHALETRRERVDPRSRADVQAIGSVRSLPPTTDEPAAAERREHGRT